MSEKSTHFDLNRLGVLSGGVLLAMALSRVVDIPTRPLVSLTIFGSPLAVSLSTRLLMAFIVVGLTVASINALLSFNSVVQETTDSTRWLRWVLPSMLSAALLGWLYQIENGRVWLGAWAICAIIIPLVFFVEVPAASPDRDKSDSWSLVRLMFIHLTAAGLFVLIYDARWRSLLSGTAVFFVAAMLASRAIWGEDMAPRRAVQYGSLVGLILGQTTWMLNYWPLSGIQGGLGLLLVFYVGVGFSHRWLEGRLTGKNGRNSVLEYGSIFLAGLILIYLVVP